MESFHYDTMVGVIVKQQHQWMSGRLVDRSPLTPTDMGWVGLGWVDLKCCVASQDSAPHRIAPQRNMFELNKWTWHTNLIVGKIIFSYSSVVDSCTKLKTGCSTAASTSDCFISCWRHGHTCCHHNFCKLHFHYHHQQYCHRHRLSWSILNGLTEPLASCLK